MTFLICFNYIQVVFGVCVVILQCSAFVRASISSSLGDVLDYLSVVLICVAIIIWSITMFLLHRETITDEVSPS